MPSTKRVVIVLAFTGAVFLTMLGFASCMDAGSAKRDIPWEEVPAATVSDPASSPEDDVAVDRLGPVASALVAFGLFPVPFLVLLGIGATRALRESRRARREDLEAVSGVVQPLDDDPLPIVHVRVTQSGSEWKDRNGTRHEWLEVRREVAARPFALRTKDGRLIRVEPPEDLLVDVPLPHCGDAGVRGRARSGSVMRGATVYVRGALHGPSPHAGESVYREASSEAVLQAPREGQMTISTQPLGRLARSAASRYWTFVAATLGALLYASVCVGGAYPLLLLDGETVHAELDGTRTWDELVTPKNGSPHTRTHREVRGLARLSSGDETMVQGECSEEFYRGVVEGERATMSVVIARHFPRTYQLGSNAGIGSFMPTVGFILMVCLWLMLWRALKGIRPRNRDDTLVDKASGALDVTTGVDGELPTWAD